MPENLSEKGKKAWQIIHDYITATKLDYTGGCRTFYSPGEWRARGEEYGTNSELIVVYDGGDVRECFDSEFKYDHEEAIREKLDQVGLYAERCTGWYSAIYSV